MTASAAPPPPPGVSPYQRCAKCKYPLRGLAPDAPCPECGSTERESPVSRPPPRWLWLWALPVATLVAGCAVAYFFFPHPFLPAVLAIANALVTVATVIIARPSCDKIALAVAAVGAASATFLAVGFAMGARFAGW
ncbi:MAG: hypothetical protein KF745_14130 [Phycisphaeraceae bacterium]|nr:hypothetical protein [Phycisphaeraceae bacterium]